MHRKWVTMDQKSIKIAKFQWHFEFFKHKHIKMPKNEKTAKNNEYLYICFSTFNLFSFHINHIKLIAGKIHYKITIIFIFWR